MGGGGGLAKADVIKGGVVYKIPYRRARAWPSASREQRYLAYKGGGGGGRLMLTGGG